jgi:Recombinase zinc beta ribbon domain
VYLGVVEWGRRPTGDWLRYRGEVLTFDGQHPALVDRPRFEAIQARLDGHTKVRRHNQRGARTGLLDGYLVCPRCGSRLYAANSGTRRGGTGCYECSARKRGLSDCQEPRILYELADEAELREVARLRGAPWQPQAFDQVVRRDTHEPARRHLWAEIAAAENDLLANVAAFRALGDVSEEVQVAFRRDNQAIAARIRALKEELEALPKTALNTMRAREIHAELARTEIADVVADGQRRGDVDMLRDVLETLVQEVRIVERRTVGRSNRTAWARAEVQWTAEAQALLDAGLLTLGPEPEPPAQPMPQELAKERARRYRARKRERLEGGVS